MTSIVDKVFSLHSFDLEPCMSLSASHRHLGSSFVIVLVPGALQQLDSNCQHTYICSSSAFVYRVSLDYLKFRLLHVHYGYLNQSKDRTLYVKLSWNFNCNPWKSIVWFCSVHWSMGMCEANNSINVYKHLFVKCFQIPIPKNITQNNQII